MGPTEGSGPRNDAGDGANLVSPRPEASLSYTVERHPDPEVAALIERFGQATTSDARAAIRAAIVARLNELP